MSAESGLPSDFLILTSRWRQAYAGAHAGVLVMRDVVNPARSAALEARKVELEPSLRSRYAGMDRQALSGLEVLKAYQEYYRRFDKTYHVQLQLESIIFKGKPIPTSAALVEAMFMAELDTLLLTAGHDLDLVQPPLHLDVAHGTESYVLLKGTDQTPKAGDMMISDSKGIISSIVYGPDYRTRINAETTQVVFTTYAPVGIAVSAVETHLRSVAANIRSFAPAASIGLLAVIPEGT